MNSENSTTGKKRILVVSPMPSHPQNSGSRARVYRLLKNLQSLGHEIHFLNCDREYGFRHVEKHADVEAMKNEWDRVFYVEMFGYRFPGAVKRMIRASLIKPIRKISHRL